MPVRSRSREHINSAYSQNMFEIDADNNVTYKGNSESFKDCMKYIVKNLRLTPNKVFVKRSVHSAVFGNPGFRARGTAYPIRDEISLMLEQQTGTCPPPTFLIIYPIDEYTENNNNLFMRVAGRTITLDDVNKLAREYQQRTGLQTGKIVVSASTLHKLEDELRYQSLECFTLPNTYLLGLRNVKLIADSSCPDDTLYFVPEAQLYGSINLTQEQVTNASSDDIRKLYDTATMKQCKRGRKE